MPSRLAVTKEWIDSPKPSVLVLTYELFGRIITNKKLISDDDRLLQQRLLFEVDLLICDEGHTIRNAKTNINQAVHEIRTNKKIILSGTPIQNNLVECKQMLLIKFYY